MSYDELSYAAVGKATSSTTTGTAPTGGSGGGSSPGAGDGGGGGSGLTRAAEIGTICGTVIGFLGLVVAIWTCCRKRRS